MLFLVYCLSLLVFYNLSKREIADQISLIFFQTFEGSIGLIDPDAKTPLLPKLGFNSWIWRLIKGQVIGDYFQVEGSRMKSKLPTG